MVEINKERLAFFCNECHKSTIMDILHDYTFEVRIGEPYQVIFAKCKNCEYPTLYTREFLGFTGKETNWGYLYQMYPPDKRELSYILPEIVNESYAEAVKCERVNAWIATVTMAGRSLEAVCKEYDPSSKTIFTGLEKMKNDGAISQEIFEWANELRVLRNIGAHASKVEIKKEDATETLDFLQAILEIIYHLRPKFNEMKNRRKSKLNS